MDRILIIGAGHAGGRLAQNLYDSNFEGEVLIFSDEKYLPYERPPLSKSYLSNSKNIEDFTILSKDIINQKNCSIFLDKKIYKIDFQNKKAIDFDGNTYKFSKIIFSNGASPNKVNLKNAETVNYLRTIDDSKKIRSNIGHINNLVILGAGFIGLEIAATVKSSYPDKKIIVIDSSSSILGRNSNENIRNQIYNLHHSKGIEFIFSNEILEIILNDKNQLNKIHLKQNIKILSDMIIAGIGVRPNVDFISNSDIEIENGIKVNEYLETNICDVYAIGDIANFKSLFSNNFVREESWNNAEKQAFILSQNILNNKIAYNEIPWFWTDQFNQNFQILGNINNFDKLYRRDYIDNKFTEFYLQKNQIVGAFAQNMGRDIKIAKEIIKKNIYFDLDLLNDPNYNLKKILK